jgi:hypothetical protein
MPLSFPSKSHDVVAFGFFNVESDMLLLENLFFFAGDFCEAAASLAQSSEELPEVRVEGWRIAEGAAIGNLHGAIAGRDHSGFIGATYEAWPFPATTEGFKQNPEGASTREEVRGMIASFGEPESIPFRYDRRVSSASVGEYFFDRPAFDMLVAYVEQGGYPRWKDEIRPSYVTKMMERLGRGNMS